MSAKDSNPKDIAGSQKPPICTMPATVLTEVGVAMMEGSRKYGHFNWRAIGVRASVYYDAVWRHLAAWFEGEDIDPDSGCSHIVKAIAGLMILRDAQIQGMCEDDRPPSSVEGWMAEARAQAKEVINKYPEPCKPFLESNRKEWENDVQ